MTALPAAARYAAAAMCCALALIVRLALWPADGGFVFLTFYPAVTLSALLLGTGPGLLSTAVAAVLCDYYLMPPLHTFAVTPSQWPALLIFCASCALVCLVTEWMRRATQALAQSGRKLAALYDSSHLGIVLTDMQGRFVEFNQAFARIVGWPAEQLRGRDFQAFTAAAYAAESAAQLATVRRTGHYGPFEKRYQRQDGSHVDVQLHGMLVRDEDGQERVWSIVEDISARVAARQRIDELMREQQTIVESNLIGIVRVRAGHIAWCNAAFARMLGYAPGELDGVAVSRLYADEAGYAAYVASGCEAALEPGLFHRAEVQQRRKDGSLGWYEISCGLLMEGSDEQIGSCVDVSERHDVAAALVLSEARLREAQAMARLGSWEVDLRSGRAFWSAQMYELYGQPATAGPLTPRAGFDRIHPDDRALTEQACAALERGAATADFTHRVLQPGGAWRYVHVRGETTCAADGTPLRSIGTAQDVTVPAQQAQALRDKEERLRSVLATMAEGLVVHAADGRVIDANAAAEEILGLSRAQLMGRTSVDPGWHAIGEDGAPLPGERHPAMISLRTGRAQRNQVMGVHAPGRGLRWISINAQPILAGDGDAVDSVVATFTDITELKRNIDAARMLAEQLEMRVAERTEQLRELGYQLESAESRERRQIARDLHDDLGQILAAARIRLAALCHDDNASVRSQATEIGALIDRANLSTRSLAAQLAPAVLYELGLGAALEWLGEEIGRTYGLNVRIVDDGQPKPLSQLARSILYRATRELLINVARHAGSPAATVLAEREGDSVVVRVVDAGVGYDPKSRAPAARHGLGLISVNERLLLLGGSTEVASSPGRGTVVVLRTPLSSDDHTLEQADA